MQPGLLGIYLFVRDLSRAVAFYRALGLSVTLVSDVFARATMANGVVMEFGQAELTRSYDPGWEPPTGPATNTINFEFETAAEVDAMYEKLTSAGYTGHLEPCDPPWGARFALIDDPDGNVIGLHSRRDREAERRLEAGSGI